MDEDGWKDWSKHVLHELHRLSDSVDGMRAEIKAIYGDVSALKVKAGIWGMIGGVIPVMVLLAVEYISSRTPF